MANSMEEAFGKAGVLPAHTTSQAPVTTDAPNQPVKDDLDVAERRAWLTSRGAAAQSLSADEILRLAAMYNYGYAKKFATETSLEALPTVIPSYMSCFQEEMLNLLASELVDSQSQAGFVKAYHSGDPRYVDDGDLVTHVYRFAKRIGRLEIKNGLRQVKPAPGKPGYLSHFIPLLDIYGNPVLDEKKRPKGMPIHFKIDPETCVANGNGTYRIRRGVMITEIEIMVRVNWKVGSNIANLYWYVNALPRPDKRVKPTTEISIAPHPEFGDVCLGPDRAGIYLLLKTYRSMSEV